MSSTHYQQNILKRGASCQLFAWQYWKVFIIFFDVSSAGCRRCSTTNWLRALLSCNLHMYTYIQEYRKRLTLNPYTMATSSSIRPLDSRWCSLCINNLGMFFLYTNQKLRNHSQTLLHAKWKLKNSHINITYAVERPCKTPTYTCVHSTTIVEVLLYMSAALYQLLIKGWYCGNMVTL